MAPILGILASSISPFINATSYESIATVTVGSGGGSSISFTGIPSTYKHLQIRASVRTTSSGYGLAYRLNSDTASNYSMHYLIGDGASVLAGNATSASLVNFFGIVRGTNDTYPTNFVMDILDYSDTNKYKTTKTITGLDVNGINGEIGLWSGSWRSTAAISTVQILSGISFAQYSSFALYGIKG